MLPASSWNITISTKAINLVMLVAISDLSKPQTSSNEQIIQKIIHLLSYATTYPDAKIRFHYSRIILYVHSNSSYLSVDLARSRIAGFFFLADNTKKPKDAKLNRVVHVASINLKNIMASTTEREIASTFDNAKDSIPLRYVQNFLAMTNY